MSPGAISLMVETGKPSTMNKGELSWVIEPPPRTRTLISASGPPSEVVTWTPAIRPVMASAADDTGIASSTFELTDETEPVRSLRF